MSNNTLQNLFDTLDWHMICRSSRSEHKRKLKLLQCAQLITKTDLDVAIFQIILRYLLKLKLINISAIATILLRIQFGTISYR